MEPLALTVAQCDKEKGTLSFMVIENGVSSKLCALLRPQELVSLMGPTGVRAKISEEQETILIVGNQLSIPLLCTYGQALRAMGNRVIYLGQFKHTKDIYCQDRIEQAADTIIWSIDSGEKLTTRPHDYSTTGDSLELLLKHAHDIQLNQVDRIYLIDNTHFLRRFQEARKTTLKDFLIKDPRVFGSVYSTMQCMLKGVCAQCLQWQIDPESGKRTKAVFACSWPDQPLELIDFDNIDERLIQNRLQEHLSNLWVDHLLASQEPKG